ncbi:MAG: hypothetical protein WBF19_00315, partial [Candidatus Cybelea sp.]
IHAHLAGHEMAAVGAIEAEPGNLVRASVQGRVTKMEEAHALGTALAAALSNRSTAAGAQR